MRKLPPLGALRAFEAAARRLSFRAAAIELGVTPTAISHQIRILENICGRPLFRRRPRPVALTDAGERLFPVIQHGFDSFAAAIAAASARGGRSALRVTSTNAFAGRWLVPRLPKWRELYPRIALEIIGTDAVLELRAGEADFAIRYARQGPADLASQEIFRDTFFPVCSPSLLAGGPITCVADLLKYPLIHFDWLKHDREAPTWSRWLATARSIDPGHSGHLQAMEPELPRRAARHRRCRRGPGHRDLQRRAGEQRAQDRRAREGARPLASRLRLLCGLPARPSTAVQHRDFLGLDESGRLG